MLLMPIHVGIHAACYALAAIGPLLLLWLTYIGKASVWQCSLQYSMTGTVQQAEHAND